MLCDPSLEGGGGKLAVRPDSRSPALLASLTNAPANICT